MSGTETALIIALGIIVVGALINKGRVKNFFLKSDEFEMGINSAEPQTPQALSPQPVSSQTQIVQVGLSEEGIKKELESREENLIKRIEEKNKLLVEKIQKSLNPEDQVDQKLVLEINILKQELSRVEAKLANTEQALEERKNVLEETEKALESEQIKNAVPEDQLAQAHKKLEKGDSSKAEELFEQILREATTKAEAGAEAAYQLAKLAEERIDYQEALRLYEKAVQLVPENSFYLNEAGVMLRTLAHYDQAI